MRVEEHAHEPAEAAWHIPDDLRVEKSKGRTRDRKDESRPHPPFAYLIRDRCEYRVLIAEQVCDEQCYGDHLHGDRTEREEPIDRIDRKHRM